MMKHINLTWFLSLLLMTTFLSNTQAQYVDESFEGNDFPPANWTLINNGNGNNWKLNTTGSNNASDGVHSMQYRFNTYKAADTWMFTPAVNLNNGDVVEIFFDYKSSISIKEELKVTVGTAATVAAQTTVLFDTNFNNPKYTNKKLTFTATANASYYFAWNCHSDKDMSSLYVDHIIVQDQPSCPKPKALGIDVSTTTSATLSWTAGGNESQWMVQYGATGFALGDGTNITANSATTKITGLTASSTYDAYVRAFCAVGDSSIWTGPITFSTLCEGVDNFNENVESAVMPALPNCWAAITSGSAYVQTTENSGNKNFKISGGNSASNHKILVSPPLNNLKENAANKWLTFKLKNSYYVVELGVLSSSTDGSTFTSLRTIPKSGNSNMNEYEIIFSDEEVNMIEADDQFLAFSTAKYGVVFIDDIVWENQPSCLKPSDLSLVGSTTTNTAQLCWVAGGSETQWIVEYGATGFALGAGTQLTANNDTTTITMLTAQTTYDAYVRAFCTAGDSSVWVGPISFSTQCETEDVFPIIETFEGDELPLCWSEARTPATTSRGWGTTTKGHTGNAVRFDSYSNGNGNKSILATNVLDLSSESALQLSFWWKNPKGGNFKVMLSTDGGNTYPITLADDMTDQASYTEKAISLNDYCGGSNNNLKIGFEGTSNYGNGDAYIYIDDLKIERNISCPKPHDIALLSTASDQATITWQAGNSESQWIVQYGTQGFTLGNGNNIVADNDTITIASLAAQTSYDAYIRALCAAGDSSAWVGPFEFTTDCASLTNINQDFENISIPYLPNCWTKIRGGSLYYNNALTVQVGTHRMVKIKKGTESDVNVILITPPMNALKANAENYRLTISLINENAQLVIGSMSDAGDASTFTALDTIYPSGNINLHTHKIELSSEQAALIATGDRYLAFENATPSSSLMMDDIVWTERPSCIPPTAFTAFDISANSAQLKWQMASGETQWIVEYGNAGFSLGSGTQLTANNDTISLSALDANTAYDAYVKSSCADDETSEWAGPINFTTLCAVINSFPYTQNFNAGSLPSCWIENRSPASSQGWDITTEGHEGNGVRFESSINPTNNVSILATEVLDLSSATDMELSFWWKNATAGNMRVLLSTDGGNTYPFTLANSLMNSADYQEKVIDLSAYTGEAYQNVRIGFEGTSNHFASSAYIYVDELKIASKTYSDEAVITNFRLPDEIQVGETIYHAAQDSIIVTGAAGINVHTIKPKVFKLSEGATASYKGAPVVEGSTVLDFSDPVNIEVTAEDGLTKRNWTIALNILVSIDEYTSDNIKIYPNPSSGIITLEGNVAMSYLQNIEIINAAGQVVEHISKAHAHNGIDLSKHSNGLYFVKINTTQGSIIKKVQLLK